MKKIIYIFVLILFLSFKASERVEFSVFNNINQKTLIFNIINYDTSLYFLPQSPWFLKKGDTLFVEAIYKQLNKNDDEISYNQFNPPKISLLPSNSSIKKKLEYSHLFIKAPKMAAIRIFDREFKNLSYEGYHLLDSFKIFELKHSKLYFTKIVNIDQIENWK